MKRIWWTEAERLQVKNAYESIAIDDTLARMRAAQQCLPAERQRPLTKQIVGHELKKWLITPKASEREKVPVVEQEPTITQSEFIVPVQVLVRESQQQVPVQQSVPLQEAVPEKIKIVTTRYGANQREGPQTTTKLYDGMSKEYILAKTRKQPFPPTVLHLEPVHAPVVQQPVPVPVVQQPVQQSSLLQELLTFGMSLANWFSAEAMRNRQTLKEQFLKKA